MTNKTKMGKRFAPTDVGAILVLSDGLQRQGIPTGTCAISCLVVCAFEHAARYGRVGWLVDGEALIRVGSSVYKELMVVGVSGVKNCSAEPGRGALRRRKAPIEGRGDAGVSGTTSISIDEMYLFIPRYRWRCSDGDSYRPMRYALEIRALTETALLTIGEGDDSTSRNAEVGVY